MNSITRRDFIKHASVFSALGAVAPQFLTRTVEAASNTIAGFESDRILVVVQLGGGDPRAHMGPDHVQHLRRQAAGGPHLLDLLSALAQV